MDPTRPPGTARDTRTTDVGGAPATGTDGAETTRAGEAPSGLRPLDLLLLLGVGAVMIAARLDGPIIASGDGLHYVLPWAEFLDGRGYTIDGEAQVVMPPGYGLLALPLLLWTGEPVLAGALLTLIAYLGTIVCSASIAERLRPGTGPIAGVLVAISPIFVATADGLLSEPTFALVLLAAARLGLAAIDQGRTIGRGATLGALGGLLYLIRPEGALSALLLPIGVALSRRGPAGRTEPSSRRFVFAAWIVALAVALPYLLFLRQELGDWALSGKTAIVLAVGGSVEDASTLRETNPELFDPRNRPEVGRHVRENFEEIVARAPRNLGRVLLALTVHAGYALPAALAVALLFGRRVLGRAPLRFVPWLVALLLPVLSSLPLFVYPRFVLPFVPIAIVALVVALCGTTSTTPPLVGPRRYAASGCALAVAWLLVGGWLPVPALSGQPTTVERALRAKIPAWRVQQTGLLAGERIGCPDDASILYAGRDVTTFAYFACGRPPWPKIEMVAPHHSTSELAGRALAGGFDWIVYVARGAPAEEFARLDPCLVPVALRLDRRVAIYRVLPEDSAGGSPAETTADLP